MAKAPEAHLHVHLVRDGHDRALFVPSFEVNEMLAGDEIWCNERFLYVEV